MYDLINWFTTHKRTVAIGVIIAGFVVLLLMLFFRTDSFTITRLNIRSENASLGVDGTTLRVYNGAFFYKRSLTENTAPKVLGGGVKLPGITHALWAGDEGVLLNFDQSFIQTAVEDVAKQERLSYEEKARSTWYFDFSDNSLHHVGNYMLYSKTHYFDSKNNTLYYLEADEGLALHAFDTATQQDRIIPLSVQFGTITQLDKCDKSDDICVTGNTLGSPTHTSIYSVKDDGTAKKVFSVDGKFYPILRSPYGIALKNKDITKSDEEVNVITEYERGALINVKTGKELAIPRHFTPDNTLYTTYGDEGDKLALVGDSDQDYTTVKQMFWGPLVQSGRLSYSDGKSFESAVVVDAMPTKNSLLLKTAEGEYGIFAPKGYVKADFSTDDSDIATDTVDQCIANTSDARSEYDEQFSAITLLIPDNEAFASSVSTINQCLTKKADILYGYALSFTAYDPESGKITSY